MRESVVFLSIVVLVACSRDIIPNSDENLRLIAKQINCNAIKRQEGVFLDTVYSNFDTLFYLYTLERAVNLSLIPSFQKAYLNNFLEEGSYDKFKRHNISFVERYFNSEQELIYELKVTPKDYN